ncbi:MAG TPA: cation:proton antiporter [Candidatus Polarisedimenticolia bacterium]|nr:cation:proton antiporter [Candidatus Polarisedimenticolia bacterium]
MIQPPPLLWELFVIFALSIAVVFVFQKLRLPVLVGFLATGVIFGPHGVGLIRRSEDVETLAEIGVILLLFTIGIEFSISRLARMRREVLLGGPLQVFGTALVAILAALPFGVPWTESIVVGFLLAFSSTAIVLRVFAERGELVTPPARVSLGLLVFQDLCVVPVILLIPLLSDWGRQTPLKLLQVMGVSLLAVGAILLLARFAIPPFLRLVVGTRSREVFLISVILVVLGTAFASSLAGLSLALGAFIAGLVVSESEYGIQVLSDILPFRDSLNCLFFVSIGMLMDVRFVAQNAWGLALLLLLVIGVKFLIVTPVVGFLGYPIRVATQTGVSLAQVGEFSFVLALSAREFSLLSDGVYKTFLAVSVLSMIIAPFLMRLSGTVGRSLEGLPNLKRYFPGRTGDAPAGEIYSAEARPVLIVGFGLNGRNLARVLRRMEIPYRVLELNAEKVRASAREGEPIVYGDSTSREILSKIGIRSARSMVVAISDPAATQRTVQLARGLAPNLPILVRTRYVTEIDELYKLGADEVIPEELEASVEVCNRLLRRVGIPGNVIGKELRGIREERYGMFRDQTPSIAKISDLPEGILESNVETHTLLPGAWALGHSLRDLDLRAATGASVIAVMQEREVFANPDPDTPLSEKDTVILLGNQDQLALACHLLDLGPEGSPVRQAAPAGG